MRCRLVTRDIPAQANARDFAHLNLKTSLEVIWGDHPINKGLIVLMEIDTEKREAAPPPAPVEPVEPLKRVRKSDSTAELAS